MAAADPAGAFAGDELDLAEIAEQTDQPVEQAEIDIESLTCRGAVLQGRQHVDGAPHSAADIAQGNAELRWRSIGLAIDAHHAAHRLCNEIEGWFVGHRPRLPEAGDRTNDQSGIFPPKLIASQAEPVHDAGPEIFQHDVRLGGEPQRDTAPRLGLEVQRQARLVAVDGQKVVALAVDIGRYRPGLVAALEFLHFPDFGAEIGQDHRAERARQDSAEVEHTDTLQRPGPPGRFVPVTVLRQRSRPRWLKIA